MTAHNIYTTLEAITPERAEAYLALNTQNRNLRGRHVAKLARDMAQGRWAMNGATIVFNGDGTLLDGQHRLAAIVESGVTQNMLVIRGVDKSAMTTIDSNISRSLSDVAQLTGYSNANRIVTAARLFFSLKNAINTSNVYVSTSEVMEILSRHPQLQDAARACDSARKFLPAGTSVPWYYLARYVSPFHEKADEALDTILTGVPKYSGDPVHVFRERVIHMSTPEKTGHQQRLKLFMTLVAAFNDYCNGTSVKMVKLRKLPVSMIGVDYSAL